jgi:hypothetical protein
VMCFCASIFTSRSTFYNFNHKHHFSEMNEYCNIKFNNI